MSRPRSAGTKQPPESAGPKPEPGTPGWAKALRIGAYAAAVLLFLFGQLQLISEQVGAGLAWMLAGLAALGLAQVKAERVWPRLLCRLSGLAAWAARLPSAKAAPAPAAGTNAPRSEEPAVRSGAPRTTTGLHPLNWLLARIPEDAREFTVPKRSLLFLGVALLLASQPFLFLEKFLLAFALLAPAIGLTAYSLFTRRSHLSLGRRDAFLRGVVLAIPGALFILIGDLILVRYVHQRFPLELLGIALNTIGVLLLVALLPDTLPDPEPETGEVLDHSLEQALPISGKVKAALAVIGAGVFWYATRQPLGNSYGPILLGALGLGAIAFSFPWGLHLRAGADAAWSPLLRIGRLLLFGVALVCAYQAQRLISAEALIPGLQWYGLAALLLVAALREPAPGAGDPLREPPLKWYWEAIGLAVILAVAFWLRARLITSMPYGIECDEAGGTINAVEIGKKLESLVANPYGAPLVLLLPRVVSTTLFGIGNLGVKADAVLFGVLGIAALFFLLRRFFGPRTALAGAALMALSRWHIHFSRFGFNNAFFITLLMIGFYFLVRGLQTRKKWNFVASGAFFSLVVQTETAARLLPLLLVVLLVYLLVGQRRFLLRNAKPLLALVLGAWLAGAAMYIFFVKNSHILLRRVAEVSINSGDPNAPRQIARGFMDSFKLSMTQLNYHGDYRQRHNGGLTGEPVLDFWTSILFALGFLYSLYHWKRWRYGVTLVWFFGFMSASIFSIEAPQSHRAFGIFPAVFLLIGALLDRSRRLLSESLGKPGVIAGGAAFLVLLFPISTVNYHKYFDTQPVFDPECTAGARFIGRYPQAEHVVMTAYLWQGHPPYQLYAREASGRFYYAASEALPFRLDTPRDVVFTTILEYPPLLPAIQYFYPNGTLHEESHPKWGLMFRAWVVPAEEIQRTRGLQARYWNNLAGSGEPGVTRKDPALPTAFTPETWPLPGSGSASWQGTLQVPHEGQYTFYLTATDPAQVELGGRMTLRADGGREARTTLYLAGGLHRFSVRAQHRTPGGTLALDWACAQGAGYYLYDPEHQDAYGRRPIPPTHLFTYAQPAGLLGTMYATRDWRGPVLQEKIEPALCFTWMGGPYGFKEPVSAQWRGWIDIPAAGNYAFEVQQPGYAEVVIDGQAPVRAGNPPPGWTPPPATANPMPLTAGRHSITVRWSLYNGSQFKFWWTPPGGERAIVPPSVLVPALEE